MAGGRDGSKGACARHDPQAGVGSRLIGGARAMNDPSTQFVAVLIAKPGSKALTPDFIDAAALALGRGQSGGPNERPLQHHCLSPGDAYEIYVSGRDQFHPPEHARDLRSISGAPDFDLAVLPAEHRRKKLLVADMESTIIQQECLDELADYVGMRPKVAAITECAMRGELDFKSALQARVGLLKGIDAKSLEEIYTQRVTLMPGAHTLLATMKAHGASCALVSGGFTFFTERIAARLGFDTHQANRLDISAGTIAGTVAEPVLGREAKLAALEHLARTHALDRALTMAVGDGANDLAMINAAGLGVAFRAKPIVAAQASVSIVHGDLTALLFLQGFARHEFVRR